MFVSATGSESQPTINNTGFRSGQAAGGGDHEHNCFTD